MACSPPGWRVTSTLANWTSLCAKSESPQAFSFPSMFMTKLK